MKLPNPTNWPRETRDTLFVLLVISWVVLPLLREVPLWCSALAAAVLGWRVWLAFSGTALPNKTWRVGLLLLAVAGTLLSYHTLLGRDAGVTLLLVLLTLKTLELRTQRDAFVIFFLSFFLMLTQFFYSQSLLTALLLLLSLWGLLSALVLAHMPVGRPSLWQAARIAGGLALLGAPIMLTLFMLFPRLAPLWGLPSDAMAGRSGLSESMTVGNIAQLALDDSVAMRLRFDGPPPQASEMYFRGPVLSTFDGQRWSVGAWSTARDSAPAIEVQGVALGYQMTLEPNQHPWLLTLETTPQAPNLPKAKAHSSSDDQWLLNRPVTELLRYQAKAYTHYQSGRLLQASQLKPWLGLPGTSNPRTQQWAQTLARDFPDPQARVQAVLKHLRDGGYRYTLEPGLYGRHSADEFWFDRKLGFCEHIAAAFVIVMRASGIAARVVTGYQGGELNSLQGFWTVRQSDAHAWAEVWLAGQGWVRVDPTGEVAPARVGSFVRLPSPRGVVANALLGTISPAVALSLRALWDATNERWNQWVLNYTQSRQLDLLSQLGFEAPSWEDLIYLLAGLLVIASLLGAAWQLWSQHQIDPWLKLLQQARRVLLKAGLKIPAQSSPRQLMQVLRQQTDVDLQRPNLQAWLLRLEALRYAPRSRQSDYRRQLATLRRDLQRLLRLP